MSVNSPDWARDGLAAEWVEGGGGGGGREMDGDTDGGEEDSKR